MPQWTQHRIDDDEVEQAPNSYTLLANLKMFLSLRLLQAKTEIFNSFPCSIEIFWLICRITQPTVEDAILPDLPLN